MAEWLIEDGIGETRAIRIEGGEIRAARIAWPGELAAGAIVEAQLVSRHGGSPRGTARMDDGTELLVDRLPAEASEGGLIRLEVTRAAIGEATRTKPAQARPANRIPCTTPTLAERLAANGDTIRPVHRFPVSGWDDLCMEAFEGQIPFAGGALLLSPTPAMTLIDIDGGLPPRQLALAAVPVIADALVRFDIGGSIGIDFPTLETKVDRRAVDAALEKALVRFPHERTAMNGFGFVQIVSRLAGPSILHRLNNHRPAAAARLLLRRAEAVADPGTLLLTCHPTVKSRLQPDWLDALARRSGRRVRVEADPALAPEAGFAQAISA